MDARTPTTDVNLPPSGFVTNGPDRAARRSHFRAMTPVDRCFISFASFATAEIFKKTPSVPDSKPGGRDVAKDILETGSVPLHGTLDVKLTDEEGAARQTKWLPRATNHSSGAVWTIAQRVEPTADAAASHPGRAHEKQCYAD
ncbi:hypothetical protein [Tardiphaga sp.]|uniref:hypothetical protein n=1 Tax=Tardiphaga sp. TaxID=1926292 RepID=UPI00262A3E11|nr:hypothetical protein [Tardiphaga sp.]MDB5616884.1 dihydroxy-acid dehydratase [Tardiphaga sp.]